MPPNSVPLTQAAIRRMIKESVDAAIDAERAIRIKGKKVKFDDATLQGHALSWCNAKVATMGLETINQMP
ncbi:hypothetical protein Tco_0696766 [Tanacetum coccineum]